MVATMGGPTIHENPSYLWMVGIHEWDATCMAFIVYPSGENFYMLGHCVVPPRLQDRALEIHTLRRLQVMNL